MTSENLQHAFPRDSAGLIFTPGGNLTCLVPASDILLFKRWANLADPFVPGAFESVLREEDEPTEQLLHLLACLTMFKVSVGLKTEELRTLAASLKKDD